MNEQSRVTRPIVLCAIAIGCNLGVRRDTRAHQFVLHLSSLYRPFKLGGIHSSVSSLCRPQEFVSCVHFQVDRCYCAGRNVVRIILLITKNLFTGEFLTRFQTREHKMFSTPVSEGLDTEKSIACIIRRIGSRLRCRSVFGVVAGRQYWNENIPEHNRVAA